MQTGKVTTCSTSQFGLGGGSSAICTRARCACLLKSCHSSRRVLAVTACDCVAKQVHCLEVQLLCVHFQYGWGRLGINPWAANSCARAAAIGSERLCRTALVFHGAAPTSLSSLLHALEC